MKITIKTLAKKVRKDSRMQETLDLIVHDHFSQQATNINNRGPEVQLEYLENECGEELEKIWGELKE